MNKFVKLGDSLVLDSGGVVEIEINIKGIGIEDDLEDMDNIIKKCNENIIFLKYGFDIVCRKNMMGE